MDVTSSILVASPPFTMGTLLPAWMRYGLIECPFRFLTHFTCQIQMLASTICLTSSHSWQTNVGIKFNMNSVHDLHDGSPFADVSCQPHLVRVPIQFQLI